MALSSVLGTQARVWYGAYDLSDFINSVEESSAINAVDVTTLTSTAVTEDPGTSQDGIKAAGFYDATADVGVDAILRAAFAAKAQAPLTIPRGGNAIGAGCTLCKTVYGTYSLAVAVGDAEAIDMEWGTREGCFGGLVLHDLSAVSGAGTTFTAAQDYGAQTTGGYAATLHVTAASGTGSPTLTVTVQTSATQGGTYVDAFSFTIVAGTTPTSEYKSATGVTLERWRRLKLVLAGTSPVYTFGVGLAGRA